MYQVKVKNIFVQNSFCNKLNEMAEGFPAMQALHINSLSMTLYLLPLALRAKFYDLVALTNCILELQAPLNKNTRFKRKQELYTQHRFLTNQCPRSIELFVETNNVTLKKTLITIRNIQIFIYQIGSRCLHCDIFSCLWLKTSCSHFTVYIWRVMKEFSGG